MIFIIKYCWTQKAEDNMVDGATTGKEIDITKWENKLDTLKQNGYIRLGKIEKVLKDWTEIEC